MKVLCLGGGAAGLYFAISMKVRDPHHEITVLERNRANDTFGWGVVLSDDALTRLHKNDPKSAQAIGDHFIYWQDIAVIRDGERTVSGGHGFAGIGRKQLLILLQQRAAELGVDLRFQTEFKSAMEYQKDYDLIVACDGLNSTVRSELAHVFRPDIDTRQCKFIWLGTHQKFDNAFTFIFERTEHGWMWAHVYQFDSGTATFIIECQQETWRRFGFHDMSKEEILAACEKVFRKHLGGHTLMSNAAHLRGSAAWIQFPRVVCEKWYHENIVLMGDAAATAHFSIGSGTRLACDSAIALAGYLHSEPSMEQAFARYQDERRLEVLKLQSAARNSLEWFEQAGRYLGMPIEQFAYSLLTRSQRIAHENLRLRDPQWLGRVESWFQKQVGGAPPRRPMFAPLRLHNMHLVNRIVVSPVAQYKAIDGCPTDWHFAHYAERAKGGAGLVCTEMVAVSARGRITPGCPGLYAPEHLNQWKRIADFVHAETAAKLCCQIGHAGRRGSTRAGWEGADLPLPDGNWPLISASAIPWSDMNQTPRAMDKAEMDDIKSEFARAAEAARESGFDMIEVQAGHGYLLSSFISPLSNFRDDGFGGSLENRMRYPLEVVAAVRLAWGSERPLSVRISATDWVEGRGVTPEEAVRIARMFAAASADIIAVSAGQTSAEAKPSGGRMFQVPLSDRVRNEGKVATMAVGNITDPDEANSILLAGRADLVCLGRPHLLDPYWTLKAAVRAGDREMLCPHPYHHGFEQALWLAGRSQGNPRT
jgi:anthraniloyl-CoA monooxygenase